LENLSQSLADSLIVEQEFLPLERALPRIGSAAEGFDACVARFTRRDLWVHALLEWRGQDAEDLDFRSRALLEALGREAGRISGRVYVSIFLVSPEALPEAAWKALERIPQGHFLSKVVCAHVGLSKDWRMAGLKEPLPGRRWFMDKMRQGSLADSGQAEEVLRQRAEEEQRIRGWLNRRGTWATYLLIAMNTAYFLSYAFQRLPAGAEPDYLALGANNRLLVLAQGQWWRLVSSLFLHFGILHLVMNMVSLFSVGAFLERLAGPGRFLTLYFLSGLVGSLVGLMNQPFVELEGARYLLPSGGASGAILGLVGALLALHWRRPRGFPKVLADRLFGALIRPTVLIFGLGAAAWLLLHLGVPLGFQLDNWAHLGGLGFGFLATFFFPFSARGLIDREA
jgi:membrane associated rhomboid family serine protease